MCTRNYSTENGHLPTPETKEKSNEMINVKTKSTETLIKISQITLIIFLYFYPPYSPVYEQCNTSCNRKRIIRPVCKDSQTDLWKLEFTILYFPSISLCIVFHYLFFTLGFVNQFVAFSKTHVKLSKKLVNCESIKFKP